ncbi:transcription regulator hth gntr [Lucifera butyrica]|uniref:Transcription regulator hth gntr n=1 Tax=Lucifera butyrica TaxID=1351585 RepID=A0A498R8M0_9FIRM|nr:GntR family transcriptional regulator [Lucifera butyrica]VBB07731.1 transcription regulator hth gntr [Lucifera butyrica]
MSKRNGSLTLTESVFLQLRTDILSGRLSPGTPLMPADLRVRFNVSTAVIREALTRLAAQGLAKQSPNYGFTVMTLSISDLENITEARRINEGVALQLAISKGDVLWESNIVALHHHLEQIPKYSMDNNIRVNDDWSIIHGKFHRALIEACDNPVLLDICNRLWNMSELYRNWSIPRENNRPIVAEHKTLMQAVLARDSNRALDLYNAHIRLTIDILIEHHESHDK